MQHCGVHQPHHDSTKPIYRRVFITDRRSQMSMKMGLIVAAPAAPLQPTAVRMWHFAQAYPALLPQRTLCAPRERIWATVMPRLLPVAFSREGAEESQMISSLVLSQWPGTADRPSDA